MGDWHSVGNTTRQRDVLIGGPGTFKLRGCEIVRHFCAHGDDGNDGCNKKGATRAARRR